VIGEGDSPTHFDEAGGSVRAGGSGKDLHSITFVDSCPRVSRKGASPDPCLRGWQFPRRGFVSSSLVTDGFDRQAKSLCIEFPVIVQREARRELTRVLRAHGLRQQPWTHLCPFAPRGESTESEEPDHSSARRPFAECTIDYILPARLVPRRV
jgi:hypothetical protein